MRDLELEGTARIEGRTDLIVLQGRRAEAEVTLKGLAEGGYVELALKLDGDALAGTWTEKGATSEVALKRTSETYPVAARQSRPKAEPEPEPKGKPKPPGIDNDLEPLRQAMLGKGSIVVEVAREDEILECVDAFEAAGIRPVLWDASGATKVLDRIRGRIAGVITRTNLPALSRAGLPVAFSCEAAEGAVELPVRALREVAAGMSPESALEALTAGAATLLGIANRVGRLAPGMDADVLLLDGPPLGLSTSVLRVWVAGEEIR